MRRLLSTAVLFATLLLFQPVAAQNSKQPPQVVRGKVIASAYPDAGGCVSANWVPGGIVGGPANGSTAHRFELEGHVYGKRFVLEPLARGADFDIVFVDETVPWEPQKVEEAVTRGPDPEWGKVPRGAQVAYVCLYGGSDALFEFRAGRGVKPPKS